MAVAQPTREAPAAIPGRRSRPSFGRQGIWLHVILVLGLVLMMVPFLWMLLGSFKESSELRQVPPTWIPENPTLNNYRELFERLNFPRYFFNSAVVAFEDVNNESSGVRDRGPELRQRVDQTEERRSVAFGDEE